MGFLDELKAARELVIDGGHRCVLDPKLAVSLPVTWIRLDALKGPTLDAHWSVAGVSVFVIVKPLDTERDLDALESELAAVAAIIPPMSDPRMVAVQLPSPGTPCPAFTYTHDLTLS